MWQDLERVVSLGSMHSRRTCFERCGKHSGLCRLGFAFTLISARFANVTHRGIDFQKIAQLTILFHKPSDREVWSESASIIKAHPNGACRNLLLATAMSHG
jgi:hypothetical protein